MLSVVPIDFYYRYRLLYNYETMSLKQLMSLFLGAWILTGCESMFFPLFARSSIKDATIVDRLELYQFLRNNGQSEQPIFVVSSAVNFR
jgi:hypothetical protein